jgi:hypothetical protein
MCLGAIATACGSPSSQEIRTTPVYGLPAIAIYELDTGLDHAELTTRVFEVFTQNRELRRAIDCREQPERALTMVCHRKRRGDSISVSLNPARMRLVLDVSSLSLPGTENPDYGYFVELKGWISDALIKAFGEEAVTRAR